MRCAQIKRVTNETDISVSICLDGTGRHDIATGTGFFDHMLCQLSRHSLIDMDIQARGDLHIDDHHTVEDVGIVLGQALNEALGDKRGICRYADVSIPMDEALADCAIDISGRPFLVWNVLFSHGRIGSFDTELLQEFFQSFAYNARIALHVNMRYGVNNHHIAESCFKAVARALCLAIRDDERQVGSVPSTKGVL